MDVGDTVFKDEDSGNILRQGTVAEPDNDSAMVRVEWDHMPGFAVWEDLSEVMKRPTDFGSCNCVVTNSPGEYLDPGCFRHGKVITQMIPVPPDHGFDW